MRRGVEERTRTLLLELARSSPDWPLEILLNDAISHELERLRKEKSGPQRNREQAFWQDAARRLPHASVRERAEMLRGIIGGYLDEIIGYFNPRVYELAARVLPVGMKALLTRFSPGAFLAGLGSRLNLEDVLTVSGPVDLIRGLSRRATLIMAPTHASNLDSIVIGLALHHCRLPPFIYGAGLNLFANPVLSFFMSNLGAYKVDRRKQSFIYKTTLKTYATMTLEAGFHNLFFPGGTRGRRGDVERKLKLGLLGCGLEAYMANLAAGKPHPDIFVIPCTLSYGLVLEAKSLIEEHLQQSGRSRFIRARRRFSRPMRILNFWRNLKNMDSRIHMHFCDPLDPFGNRVDAEGRSLDARGRFVDRTRYVKREGRVAPDPQRDRQYTRELGSRLLEAYRRNNTVLSTHEAAFAYFHCVQRAFPRLDLYRLLRVEGEEGRVPEEAVLESLEALHRALAEMEDAGEIRMDERLRAQTAPEVLESALAHFRSFHNRLVLRRKDGGLLTGSMRLLYYYRNRLDHYHLERRLP